MSSTEQQTECGRRQFLSTSGAFVLGAVALPDHASAAQPETIKIAQIGVGHAHADGKMAAYKASKEFEVVGVAEPDASLRERAQAGKLYGGLPFTSVDKLLATPGLRAVAVETRVRDLLGYSERCVDAGLHVHIDKPAGSSMSQFRRILKKARQKQLCVQLGYMYRYNPGVLLLHDLLKKGWLGDVFEVHAVMSKVVGASTRRALGEYPGGMMFELGCHIIDLVVGILGRPEKVTPFPRHSSPLDDSLVDNMLAVFEYPKATATVRTSAQEVEGFARRHIAVCGTGGTFHLQPLDDPKVRLALDRPRGAFKKGYQDVTFPRYRRYVGDAADFAKIIRGEKNDDFSYEHEDAVQETVLKASGLPLD